MQHLMNMRSNGVRENGAGNGELPTIPPMSMVTAMALINQVRNNNDTNGPQRQQNPQNDGVQQMPRISNMPSLTGM